MQAASGIQVVRVDGAGLEAAAARLVGKASGNNSSVGRTAAAKRFIQSASNLGIDLSLFWATIEDSSRSGPLFRQVCLAVLGSGRTATFFVSSDEPPGVPSRGHSVTTTERAALIQQACSVIASAGPGVPVGVRLAQTLLEPGESELVEAFTQAGFLRLGDLAYLSRAVPRRRESTEPKLPSDIVLRCAADLAPELRDRHLVSALERSYVETLDCPELAGLRTSSDVLDSHKAVGEFEPSLWWIVYANDEPVGCMLLSRCPEHASVELVYLGLGKSLRGRGIGSALLHIGLNRIAACGMTSVTCAVDLRNEPAQTLYRRAGFKRVATRVPLVRGLGAE